MKINDFSVLVATVNGSGSQSSNLILLRSLFRMGVPVSGKNLFPSNIQGFPTWFTIRASAEGWLGRKVEADVLVCMNDETFIDDVRSVPPGAAIIHQEHMNFSSIRQDVVSLPIPFHKIIAQTCSEAKFRKLAINMIYVGVLAEFMGIPSDVIEQTLQQQFRNKTRVMEFNRAALEAGRTHVKEKYQGFDFPCKVERLNKIEGQILIEGNAAIALGAVFGGCTFVSWYPITPSSSTIEYFSDYAEKYRLDPTTHQKTYAVVQAEDECASLGMVLGASWAGARAMTATSGPGLSLMAELTGYGYYAEIPAVIVDVQRVGPSTGLPTRTSQGDILSAAFLSHGDTKHILLIPGTVEECFEFALKAFDIAERVQTPIFLMSDLDLGMNIYQSNCFKYPTEPFDRGKVLTEQDQDKLKTFFRYNDIDGDGIPYRTLPGFSDRQGVFFTRGSGHNAQGAYTEKGPEYQAVIDRLKKKLETAQSHLPHSILVGSGKNKKGIIAYGSTHEALMEALHILKTEFQTEVDYLRLRAFPFDATLEEFLRAHEEIYVVEQNRDGQMATLLRSEKKLAPFALKIESILHYDGLPIHARYIVDQLMKDEFRKAFSHG